MDRLNLEAPCRSFKRSGATIMFAWASGCRDGPGGSGRAGGGRRSCPPGRALQTSLCQVCSRTATWLGAFDADCLKPLQIVSTHRAMQQVKRKKPTAAMPKLVQDLPGGRF